MTEISTMKSAINSELHTSTRVHHCASVSNILRHHISPKAQPNRSSLRTSPGAAHVRAHKRRISLDTGVHRRRESRASAISRLIDSHCKSKSLAQFHIIPNILRPILLTRASLSNARQLVAGNWWGVGVREAVESLAVSAAAEDGVGLGQAGRGTAAA